MILSPHFALEELTHSETAVRLGIDNTPSAEVIEHLKVAADGMECVRTMLGAPIHANSGFRCEALERVIAKPDYVAWCARHGVTASEVAWRQYFAGKAHPKGYAVDWTCRGFGDPLKIVRFLSAQDDLKFDQLLQEGPWVHASFDPQMRRIVRTAHFVNGVPHYTEGVSAS